jgi:phage terminase large subunit-like protein
VKKDERDEIAGRLKRIETLLAERRRENRLARYNAAAPVHQKQLAFHRCQKRNRWVLGGNRSGKTECGAVETVWRARGIHPYRENRDGVSGWVVSLSRDVQREVAQRKVLYYLYPGWIEDIVMVSGKSTNPAGGVIDHITVKNVFGGLSYIGFKSLEMGRDKFQGASLDFVWFDEEPAEDVYDECRMRVMDKKGDIFGTMTPLLGLTFVYNRIYLNERNDPDIWHIFMEWADNPFLDPGEIDRLSAALSEEELSARRYGRFVSGKGLVYPEFDERVHVIEPFDVPKEWYDLVSIDPGLNNPTSCHFYAADFDGNVYVVAEHYEKGQPVPHHARRLKETARRLGWHFDGKGRLEALIDSAAGQRTLAAQKSVAELFYEADILVNTRVNKDLFSGISRVKSYLKPLSGPPRLYIFSSCRELIREIKGYFWGSGDTPRKADDHALDELRYYLMHRGEPVPAKPPAQRSEILSDKERLIRRTRRNFRR